MKHKLRNVQCSCRDLICDLRNMYFNYRNVKCNCRDLKCALRNMYFNRRKVYLFL